MRTMKKENKIVKDYQDEHFTPYEWALGFAVTTAFVIIAILANF